MSECDAAHEMEFPSEWRWLAAALLGMVSSGISCFALFVFFGSIENLGTIENDSKVALNVVGAFRDPGMSALFILIMTIFSLPASLIGLIAARGLFQIRPTNSIWPYLTGGAVLGLGWQGYLAIGVFSGRFDQVDWLPFVATGLPVGTVAGFVFWWYLWRLVRKAKARDSADSTMSD